MSVQGVPGVFHDQPCSVYHYTVLGEFAHTECSAPGVEQQEALSGEWPIHGMHFVIFANIQGPVLT